MNKKFLLFFAATLTILFAGVLSSCDKDDDVDPATHDPELVGVWEQTDRYGTETLSFYSNGTFEIIYSDQYYEEDNGWTKGNWYTEENSPYNVLHLEATEIFEDGEYQEIGIEKIQTYYSINKGVLDLDPRGNDGHEYYNRIK